MKQNPLCFLDIDGVLNSILFLQNATIEQKRNMLDPNAITLLNELIEKTDAKVVVTSTWRLHNSIQDLQSILESFGFKGEIIDKTKDLRVGPYGHAMLRGNEVLEWMKDHPSELGVPYYDYNRYVILDDDSDFLFWQRNNLIVVDGYCGLTPKNVFTAKRILDAQTSYFASPY